MIGIPGEAGVNTKKVTVDLESEEVPGRGTVCEEPRGPGRLGVFGGKWATVVVAPTDSGKDGRPGNLISSLSSLRVSQCLGPGVGFGRKQSQQ